MDGGRVVGLGDCWLCLGAENVLLGKSDQVVKQKDGSERWIYILNAGEVKGSYYIIQNDRVIDAGPFFNPPIISNELESSGWGRSNAAADLIRYSISNGNYQQRDFSKSFI